MVKKFNSPFKIRNQIRLSYIITKNRRCHNWQGTNRIPVHKWQTVTTESKCQQLKTMPKRLRLKSTAFPCRWQMRLEQSLKTKTGSRTSLGPPFHPWNSRRGRKSRAVLSAVAHGHTPLNGVHCTMPMRAEKSCRRESQKLNSDTKGMKKECIKRSGFERLFCKVSILPQMT